MFTISRLDLEKLAADVSDPAVSVYMPMACTWPEAGHSAAQFRQLLDTVESQLRQAGYSRSEAHDLLSSGAQLEPEIARQAFPGARGLALFLAPGFSRHVILPYECPETAELGRGFYITPLVPLHDWDFQFLLLALSPKHVRIYRASRRGLEPLELPAGMPHGVDEIAAGMEVETGLQYHTVAGFGVPGSLVGAVAGHGDPRDDRKTVLTDYFRVLGRHMEKLLAQEDLPLVLAGVEASLSAFHAACDDPHLLSEGVVGSADELSEDEMHQQAVPIAEPWHRKARRHELDRIERHGGTEQVSRALEEILPAASQGRVELIAAAEGARVWGTCQPRGEGVQVHANRSPGDVDLMNEAVRQTLVTGGTVHVLPAGEIPGGGLFVAHLRW